MTDIDDGKDMGGLAQSRPCPMSGVPRPGRRGCRAGAGFAVG
ncbi:hypothetical protein [Actinomadura bangladeshensis]|nr:hypothetical protein [Actinomadura bangladeshensis]